MILNRNCSTMLIRFWLARWCKQSVRFLAFRKDDRVTSQSVPRVLNNFPFKVICSSLSWYKSWHPFQNKMSTFYGYIWKNLAPQFICWRYVRSCGLHQIYFTMQERNSCTN